MRKSLLFFTIMLLSAVTYAQVSVSGTVVDASGESLPGVNVIAVGTSVGTSTDFEGNFEINAPADAQGIEFSFIGYADQTISMEAAQAGNIQITLQEDANLLEGVVLVGYGTQKKSDITGSTVSVKSEDLQDQPVGDASALLQGRAAGVRVTQNSGAPGAGTSVTIRGIGTINSTSPIYVVDGIFLDNIDHINPSDIASIEVLKDASASAIYGSRGAGGVILVATKKGNTDEVSVRVEMMAGMQSAWKTPDLMSSQDWLATTEAARINGGMSFQTPEVPSDNIDKTTDWFDAITRSGAIYKTNVTVSRGDEKSDALLSVGYFKNEGTIIGSDYSRLNLRLNTNYKISKMFRTGINLSMSSTEENGVSTSSVSGVLLNAQRMDPVTSVRDPRDGGYASSIYNDLANPVANAIRDTRPRNSLLVLMNTYLEFEPIKNLVFKTSFSGNVSRSKSHSFYPTYNYSQGGEVRNTNTISKSYSEFTGWLTENTVSYSIESGDHSISAVAGFTAEGNYSEYLSASRDSIANDSPELQYLNGSIAQQTTASNSGVDTRMYSYLGRINYNYADKYFLTASVRQDGSSKFGPENRYGTFPSASFGWKLRNEGFMDFMSKDVVTHMMIRTGWGQVGNSNIGAYGFSTTLRSAEGLLEYSYVLGGGEQAGLAPVDLANKALKWEAMESTNIGLDLGFYNNKITFSFDYFVKNTKDMIVGVPIPSYSGYYRSPQVNAGNMSNKGFEMNLGFNGSVGDDFTYSISGNLSHVSNTFDNLAGGEAYSFGSATHVGSVRRASEGEEYGYFYGYEVDGVFQTQAEVDASAQSTLGIGAGDFKFKDQRTFNEETGEWEDPDGVLNDKDRVKIGSPYPDFIYGLNLGAGYKGFDFTMFFQGEQGKDIFNAFKYSNYSTEKHYALSNDYKNHWTAENGSNTLFGLNSKTESENLKASDFYIEDGSYLRLKNIQLGYTFSNPTSWLNNARIYVSGQNVFTITGYSGLDPEVGSVDNGVYPQSRIWSVGANLSF